MITTLKINNPSRIITSNQTGVHPNLPTILDRHLHNDYLKPVTRHTLEAFNAIEKIILPLNKPIILDSGCGVGESTIYLARQYPGHIILGIDKSVHRLQKNPHYQHSQTVNFFLVRADLFDFWRLAIREQWRIDKHFIFYPNPWPLKKDVRKRFHGHPVFPELIRLGNIIEVRSNWSIYMQEFAYSYQYITGKKVEIESFTPVIPVTPFERKYMQSRHSLYRLVIDNRCNI